jgi:hypothetical protein
MTGVPHILTRVADRMTVPPNVLAAVGIAFGAWLAALTGRRAVLIIIFASIAIIGSSAFISLCSAKLTPH